MYSKKLLYNTVFNSNLYRPNLNVSVNVNSNTNLVKYFSTTELKFQYNNFVSKFVPLKYQNTIHSLIQQCEQILIKQNTKLKNESGKIIRTWLEQCKFIAAQRLRRSQQMFSLYTRLWDEHALKALLARIRQQFSRRSKNFVLGAMGISAYNWEQNRISNDEIYAHATEFNYVRVLKQQTVVCRKCGQRRVVDIMLPDVKYCKCNANKTGVYDNWVPYIERKDLLVWRRQHKNGNSYEYKLYGVYDDVTAKDFLQVQVDTDYRQRWDSTAINLHIVDHDPVTHSDIIYWEMLWPRMFANRDYVYNRRYIIDHDKKLIMILSKSTEHPSCPIKQDKHRVSDYESCMVIKPINGSDLNEAGIEFTLTYFDDPGVNIPTAITSWVAMAGMPDFLCKLRKAARDYHQHKPQVIENRVDDVVPIPDENSNLNQSSNYWHYIYPYYYS